ncbi:MAG: DinB family protein [Meiothermus sp.]|nr:DinB family protein [Meiothermus sp.]
MNPDLELRKQLVNLLTLRQAHADFEDAVADFPEEHINTRPPGCPYTFWHLVEHLRLAQKDILDYIVSDQYHWPTFPDDYWPGARANTDLSGWNASVEQFLVDRQELVALVQNPAVDLLAPLPNSGRHQHNLLREIHIVAAHNAYHTGELIVLRRVRGTWRP